MAPPENRSCTLLSSEENDQIFRLLGLRCSTLVTTVVQLYQTQLPQHNQWMKRDTGILCFVKDNHRKNYFFRLYCLRRNGLIWEHEMYNNMEYIASCPFLHTFEGEEYMVAFNFASNVEAKEMRCIVEAKIQTKRRRDERRSRNSNSFQEQSPRLPLKEELAPYRTKYTDPAVKKAKRKRNITKADIGAPSEFRHISHIGWDPSTGLDINCEDPQLQQFFEKAGVSEKQLQDRDTREFIYDFINKHGGREAVQEEVQQTKKPAPMAPQSVTGPPVPPRGSVRPSHNRVAPPPPPSTSLVQPTKPPPTPKNLPQVPQPPAGVTPPPPPPPPPPPSMELSAVSNNAQSLNQDADGRCALMESIREGASLKPVDVERKITSDDARGDLLSEIRKGFQLKPASEREIKPVSPAAEQGHGDLAGALARALAERSRVIHSEDDSTSDTDSNDDEWDA